MDSPEVYNKASMERLIDKGESFEKEHLSILKSQGIKIMEIAFGELDAEKKSLEAMKLGYDVIYQARLISEKWSGWADFLIKVEKPSKLGNWSYQVWDT